MRSQQHCGASKHQTAVARTLGPALLAHDASETQTSPLDTPLPALSLAGTPCGVTLSV